LFVIYYLLLVIACRLLLIACCLLPVDMLSITVELNHVMCWYAVPFQSVNVPEEDQSDRGKSQTSSEAWE